MSTSQSVGEKSQHLQTEIDRISATLHVPTSPNARRAMTVGRLGDDGVNVYVADDGTYHFAYCERGQLVFDHAGGLDDLLYWYSVAIASDQANKSVGDPARRFHYEFQLLSGVSLEWAKRRVRELAASFRERKPEDLALLPDIGEPAVVTDAKVFYSTPFGDTRDGRQRLFLLHRDGVRFMPVFRTVESMKEFYERMDRAAFVVLKGTVSAVLTMNRSIDLMSGVGIVIDPFSDHPVEVMP